MNQLSCRTRQAEFIYLPYEGKGGACEDDQGVDDGFEDEFEDED